MALRISVVIPVYNAEVYLRSCLDHLKRSSVAPFECIVVDDGSTDKSVDVAREYGATILSSPGRCGPACARNLGAKAAQGNILFFIDADVCVHPNTLERLVSNFEQDATLDAVIGSYDDSPECQDFLSQYRNLMHCFVHRKSRREACTFWSGCGAIRRELFLEHSGFDESYKRPAIEDIELGYRLKNAGCHIILDSGMLVKHLKRWTFWRLLKTDLFDRGIPWTELILRDRSMPNDLNLHISQRISVALVFLVVGLAVLQAIYWRGFFLVPLFTVLFFLLCRYWVERVSKPKSNSVLVAVGLVIASIIGLAYWFHMLGLIPLVLLACLMLFAQHHYAYAQERRRRIAGKVLGSYLLMSIIIAMTYLPRSAVSFGFVFLLLVLVILNNQFYLFLAARRGRLFAFTAIPFHLLYHFYNGIAFMIGLTRHVWQRSTAPGPVKPLIGPTRDETGQGR